MSFEFIREVISPSELLKAYPLPQKDVIRKRERDKEIKDIIMGSSDKFLVVIGPCSADHEDAVCDYISRLARVQDIVKDRLVLVPRVYTNKPRTTGEGYKVLFTSQIPKKNRICRKD